MAQTPSPDSPHIPPPSTNPWPIAVAGLVALAVAMGIGRFAFTPLLPMMLHDGVVDLPTASWLASANYIGYLLGALLCTFQPWVWRQLGWQRPVDPVRALRIGLAATALFTLGMALPWPPAWPLLRFAAGVASALVFVFTSGWCLTQLAQRQAGSLGGVMYAGPGAGIVASGLAASALVAAQWRAAAGWVIFGVLAAVLTASVWRVFRSTPATVPGPAAAAATAAPATPPTAGEIALLALAYGLAGFGYIVTATFLPVIARAALPDATTALDLFWPLFGLGVIGGALLSSRLSAHGNQRLRLAVCYVIQAAGVLASLVSPSLVGFALGSLLLGLPFTAITFFAMQEARRLRPDAVASTMGLLTVLYGAGQIVGPPLVAALVARVGSAAQGFTLSLEVASGALLVGAVLYGVLMLRYPLRPAGR